MSCDHDWTIQFPDVNDGAPFEFRPVTMSLKMSREKYDFCRAKASWEVGELMKPHTKESDGKLAHVTPVDICYNGQPVQRLAFRPDWADYASHFTHLQFHDLHKALASGIVDIQRETVQLRNIYQTVIENADNDLVQSLEFNLPDNAIRTIYGQEGVQSPTDPSEVGSVSSSLGDVSTIEDENSDPSESSVEEDPTAKALDSKYAVDFQQISPESAIRRLNKKFRLMSWITADGTMVVGLPEVNQIRHLAAPDDERVWRYKDPQISHGREPIKSVVVEGAWVDDPGLELNFLNWFDRGGTGDFKAMGIAERTDIEEGTQVFVKSSKAKRDALPHIATLALQEKMKQQNKGTVEIDPALSGEEVSPVVSANPGDLLHVVPKDELFYFPSATTGEVGDTPDNREAVCGGWVRNEAYVISEVEHTVTEAGDWQVFTDLGMYPDVPIEAFMDYFNPKTEQWVDSDQLADDGSLQGGAIFEEF